MFTQLNFGDKTHSYVDAKQALKKYKGIFVEDLCRNGTTNISFRPAFQVENDKYTVSTGDNVAVRGEEGKRVSWKNGVLGSGDIGAWGGKITVCVARIFENKGRKKINPKG